MTTTDQKQTPEISYVRIPMQMLRTGKFTTDACIVYSYMLNRYRYFLALAKTRNKQPEYYESIPSISKQTGTSQRSIKRVLKLLRQEGYLHYNLTRKGASFNNTYTVYDKHCIYQDKQTQAPTVAVSTKQPEIDDRPLWMRDDFDDTNLPF